MKSVIRRAILSDIDCIYNIIKPYADEGLILPRSNSNIKKNINNFLVAEVDEEIAGVISHYDYGRVLQEVRTLAVKKGFYHQGIGSALLISLVEVLLDKFQHSRIFVLTYSRKFFEKFGFIVIDKDYLPEKIWKDCQKCKEREHCSEIALIYSNSGSFNDETHHQI